MNMIIFNFLIGSCLGSHALVVVNRNKNSEDFLFSFSRCDICYFPLTLLDQIPILSFIIKKGKCSFCHSPISSINLLVEIFAGFYFMQINFLDPLGIIQAIAYFFFLLIGLQDYYDQAYSTNLLLIPLLIIILDPNSSYHHFLSLDWIIFLLFTAIFLLMNLIQKFGLGDSILLLLFFPYFGIYPTLTTLLISCFLFLILFLLEKNSAPRAFIPYLLFGLTISSL